MRTEHAHARAHTHTHTHTHTCAFLQTFHTFSDFFSTIQWPTWLAQRDLRHGLRHGEGSEASESLQLSVVVANFGRQGQLRLLHAADFARRTNLCQADLQGADSVPGG